jgi:hypothetical protein
MSKSAIPALFSLLVVCHLAAQEQSEKLVLDLHTDLGTDPDAQILLVPRGCLDGLVLGATQSSPRPKKGPGMPEATVEVWDLALVEAPRREAFRLYWEALRLRLRRAMTLPPPSHGAIELGEFMSSDPSNPQKLDLTKVQSMQERFNRIPPNGSPAKN